MPSQSIPLDVTAEVSVNLEKLAQAVVFGIVLYCLFFFLVVWYQRALWRRSRRRGKKRWDFYPTSASIGNALHTLQAIAQPEMAYVLEEKLNDEAEEDDEGEPENPQKLFHRQLKRIRNGERVERLRVRHKALD